MPEINIGFEAHQPFRLNRHFPPDTVGKVEEVMDLYFDPGNKDILAGIVERSYTPTTQHILEQLDQGFACSFSFSGILLEQLERWYPDALHLFEQVARHKNVELLGQTYYHSVAGYFDDMVEYKEQIRLQSDLMRDLFHKRPTILGDSQFQFSKDIVTTIKKMGLSGMYTEGNSPILEGKSPDHVYSYQGIALVPRNTTLCDDITHRFTDCTWNQYPLTADKYAEWVASSSGDVVTLFLNYETFGEHLRQETGILDFLSSLCSECQKRNIDFILPSHAITLHPRMETSVAPVSGEIARPEMKTPAWRVNDQQLSAFSALQQAQVYAKDKKIWRYLQTTDHFRSMGGYGEGQELFNAYMRILSDFEEKNVRKMKNKKAAMTLRTVPPEHAFHFASQVGYIGYRAHNLKEFLELLQIIPEDSFRFHQDRGDFALWVEGVLENPSLAEQITGLKERRDIVALLEGQIQDLWKRLK